MDLVGKAKRVRVYVKEGEDIGRRPAPTAVLEWLRTQGVAGATLFRAVAGLGASGRVEADLMPELLPHLPAVVEWIDSPERVERLLPRLKEFVGHGLITVEDTEVALWKPRGVRNLTAGISAAEVMSRDVASVAPDAPLRKVVELMAGKVYHAVPVVADGRPVGIITNQDLVERGGLLIRLGLLGSLTALERESALQELDREGKKARDVMTGDPVTVPETASITAVADLMARRRLKRLPVVDAAGKLAGVVSRLDLLRTLAEGLATGAEEPRTRGLRGDVELGRLMRTDVPVLRPDASLREVLEAVVSAPLHRAFVVDADRRVLGIVTDEEVLDRVTPAVRTGALRWLTRRLPFSQAWKGEIEAGQHARAKTARDLMLTDVPIARDDQRLRDTIAPMMKASHKLLAVVDAERRLVGALDRADVLRGLVEGAG